MEAFRAVMEIIQIPILGWSWRASAQGNGLVNISASAQLPSTGPLQVQTVLWRQLLPSLKPNTKITRV